MRSTAGLAGFFTLIQLFTRPLRYGRSRRFEIMPSRPNLQACSKDDRAVALDMFGQPHTCRPGQQLC
jgi:hypothetical protein